MTEIAPSPEDLSLVLYPDPRLRRKARPLEDVDEETLARIAVMVEVLNEENGIGLAATQVGWMERVCLINPSGKPGEHEVFLNPEIVGEEAKPVAREEGCLSLPGIYGTVSRPDRIRVRYFNLDGEEVEREAEGLEATVIQHELDHLDGILFITKVTPADRLKMKKALQAMEEAYKDSDGGTGARGRG